MPESEDLKQLLMGSKLDYFKSKRIVEILKTTEADSKNIFGYYSSQRMKDWQDIVYSYERDYIYLAEISTDLIRETNYEIPGIRKVIQKLNRTKDELEKEKANLTRRSQQFNSEYQKLAQIYGIKGENVAQELRDKSDNMGPLMNEILGLAKELGPAIEFYRENASVVSKQESKNFLATLHYVITSGNTTVYQWKYNEAPVSIEAAVESTGGSSAGASNPSDEIDFGTDEIDFGDDLPSSSESSSGFVHVETSNTTNDDTFVNLTQVEDAKDGIARGDDAKLVLEFRKSRSQFLNNLYELESFLKQYFSETPGNSSNFSSGDANKANSKIRQIIDIVNKDKNRVLFQLNDSPTFIDNINEKFISKAKQASENSTKATLLDDKIREVELQARETEIHLKKSIMLAKELQSKVENSISELYKGRVINIMGCVS